MYLKKIFTYLGLQAVLTAMFLTAAGMIQPCTAGAYTCGQFHMDPPFLPETVPPLVMLVMGRDHKMYYEAYNDASDLNNDGELDIGYRPDEIDYYGYFDSFKCYTYSSANERFEPQAVTEDKKCSAVSGDWSGDFLNYLTMSRMDTIRKVLYGGYRSTDSESDTVLERVFIPQDGHSWGKEYSSTDQDGYDISLYSPLSQPDPDTKHLFASTTLSDKDPPILRVLENNTHRIWEWVAKERPVADESLGTPEDYTVAVQVCKEGLLEDNCKTYPGADGESDPVYKPVGLLQKYGEGDSMYFGLMTGSYENNMSGGVLRKNISSITDEINAETGQFTSVNGIIQTINSLRIVDFDYSNHDYNGGWLVDKPMPESSKHFPDWGNPVAEMMYESLRYFGNKTANSEFIYSSGKDASLGLPLADWEDPFQQNGNNLYCARPMMLVISDIYPSYDSDQLPGSAFGDSSWTSGEELGNDTLNVSTLLDSLSSDISGDYFIGENSSTYDSSCSPKNISNDGGGLGSVRGLCPEEPTKQGSYYAGAVAHYGRNTDLRTDLDDSQQVSTFSVAMSSPLPQIDIPVGDQTITLIPFGKTVKDSDSDIDASEGKFQPTNTIVNFFVQEIASDGTSGKFRINFEDVEQGADHDMDVIVLYEYQVQEDNTVDVTLTKEYQAAGYTLHIGYIISGTTNDGIYLEVASKPTDVEYFLDTPVDRDGPGRGDSTLRLHCLESDDCISGDDTDYSRTRNFTPGDTPAAQHLENPLWYAARWGAYPDGEDWDRNQAGIPDNYFYVTNPLYLEQQLTRAFQLMLNQVASGSAASVLSTSRRGAGLLAQAVFWPTRVDGSGNEVNWAGDVRSLKLDSYGLMKDAQDNLVEYFYDSSENMTKACVGGQVEDGGCADGAQETALDELNYLWTASDWLNSITDAQIVVNRDTGSFNANNNNRYIFTWNDNDNDGIIDSGEIKEFTDANAEDIPMVSAETINWIRGLDQEGLRSREYEGKTWRLGDIVHSSPVMVGPPAENYDLIWRDPTYGKFYREYRDRRNMVYYGANDGMLHAVNAGFYSSSGFDDQEGPPLGAEMWAYVPYNLLPHLECLADPDYSHQYYVDLRPRIFDVKIFPSSATHPGGWGTILVGGMRLGGGYVQDGDREFGSSFFVLDITNPESPPELLGETTLGTAKKACANNKDCINLGYTVSVPTVVPVEDAGTVKWFLVLGSGPDNDEQKSIQSTRKGKFAVIPMEPYLGDKNSDVWSSLRIPDTAPSPTTSGRIELSDNSSFISTGLTSVDYDFDFFTDILFYGTTTGVGDSSKGELQHMKVESRPDPKDWGTASVFKADKPVTGEPNVGWYGDTVWLYFGSGRFWEASDKLSENVQTMYGIMEKKKTTGDAYNFASIGEGQLEDVSNVLVNAQTHDLFCETGQTCDQTTLDYETFEGLRNNIISASNTGGWFRDLPAGERVLGQPSLFGGVLNFTTFHPDPDDDVCSSQGSSRLYSLYYLTGTSWISNVFGGDNPVQGDDEYVQYIEELGPGITITPSLHLGDEDGTNVFIQTGPGTILNIKQPELPSGSARSGRSSWHTIDTECQDINSGQTCPEP